MNTESSREHSIGPVAWLCKSDFVVVVPPPPLGLVVFPDFVVVVLFELPVELPVEVPVELPLVVPVGFPVDPVFGCFVVVDFVVDGAAVDTHVGQFAPDPSFFGRQTSFSLLQDEQTLASAKHDPSLASALNMQYLPPVQPPVHVAHSAKLALFQAQETVLFGANVHLGLFVGPHVGVLNVGAPPCAVNIIPLNTANAKYKFIFLLKFKKKCCQNEV